MPQIRKSTGKPNSKPLNASSFKNIRLLLFYMCCTFLNSDHLTFGLMMLETVRSSFHKAVKSPPWLSELAGILPLSALIDFLDTARVLHMFQLTGEVPLWCWPVTPSGSRLILDDSYLDGPCCLDRPGMPGKLECLDGRWGDHYLMSNSETIRLCVQAMTCFQLQNEHPNMLAEKGRRPQVLELVVITNLESQDDPQQPDGNSKAGTPNRRNTIQFVVAGSSEKTLWREKIVAWTARRTWMVRIWGRSIFRSNSIDYVTTVTLGWLLITSLALLTTIMHCWVALGFLFCVIVAGLCVSWMHSGEARRPTNRCESPYQRLIITADDMNAKKWIVFLGEGRQLNPLLNWPLLSSRDGPPNRLASYILRTVIFGQWCLALAAAATKGWDALIIAFWIMFCSSATRLCLSADMAIKRWMTRSGRFSGKRFVIQLSSRRALLTSVMALNPDTLVAPSKDEQTGNRILSEVGTAWLDPILKSSDDRTSWQNATREALKTEKQARNRFRVLETRYQCHAWWRFVPEGIEAAEKLIAAMETSK